MSLTRAGHSVDQATNGAIALGRMKRNQYDLVLMDLQMPVMVSEKMCMHRHCAGEVVCVCACVPTSKDRDNATGREREREKEREQSNH